MKLSERIQGLGQSGTVKFTALLHRLREEGRDIIDLAVGEPDFGSPPEVIDATKLALDSGETRYSPVCGLDRLRAELAGQHEGYDASNVVVSNGSKQVLYSLFQVICDPGDEVIIPVPCWVSFPEQVRLAGARPVFVGTDNFQLDPGAVEKAVTSRTRIILINSPNNPSGAVYPESAIKEIARLALEKDLVLLSDEAYRHFIYDDRLRNVSISRMPEIRDRSIIVRSFSKSFSMGGFRVGYMLGPDPAADAVCRIQSHLTGNVCTFAQYGALSAAAMNNGNLAEMRITLGKRRDLAYHLASRLFECVYPQGAFYLFPDVSKILKKGQSSSDLAAMLLEKAGVAVVPGEVFAMPGHIRISYAASEDRITEGLGRIAALL